MNRLAAILVVALIGGTAAAFAYAQTLKQAKSPIFATKVRPHQFSPVCDCPLHVVRVGFGLRRSDHLTLSILDSSGRVIRNLIDDRAVPKGYHSYTWNGHFASGKPAPDGVYRPRVDLADADRTITMPSLFRIDTVPPRITGANTRTTATQLLVRYVFSEQGQALLFVHGRRVLLSKSQRQTDVVKLPLADLHGSTRVSLVARDLAGNLSRPRVLKIRLPKGAR